MQVTIHAAKTNLSKLIEAARNGEEVVIAKGDKPMVKLVPVKTKKFQYGVMADKLKGPIPDFLEPMDEEGLALWEGREDERL